MQTSNKVSLRLNDFKENINDAFVSLRKDTDFTDVTLVCEDGHQFGAHKVILASSSPFFKNLLTRNNHSQSLLYMRGVKSEDLNAIIDFIYYGEANIYQENLESFLQIAEDLKLKGLNEDNRYKREDPPEPTEKPISVKAATKKNKGKAIFDTGDSELNCKKEISSKMAVFLSKNEFRRTMKELDEQIEAMLGRSDNMIKKGDRMKNGDWKMIRAYKCQVCGKEGTMTNIKAHIEKNHIDGIVLPCTFCEKTFNSRSSLRNHNFSHN